MKNFITNSPNQYCNLPNDYLFFFFIKGLTKIIILIVQLLLRAFTPQSNANFNHIKLILAWSMENFVEFKKLLYSSDFIPLALNYLHEPSVIVRLFIKFSTFSIKITHKNTNLINDIQIKIFSNKLN